MTWLGVGGLLYVLAGFAVHLRWVAVEGYFGLASGAMIVGGWPLVLALFYRDLTRRRP